MKYVATVVLFAACVFAPCVFAADKVARFEVASIRPSAPGGTSIGLPKGVPLYPYCAPPFGSQLSSVQVTLINCTVHDLVRRAWGLEHAFELSVASEPTWISSARYDITAKSTPVSPREHEQVLQPLLEERFRLKWHREKHEMPVYYLSVAKGGLKLPLTKAGSCTPWDKKGPPPPPYPDKPPTCDYTLMPRTRDGFGMGMDGTGVPIASMARELTGLLGRPVIDQTGLTAVFDVHFKFARDSSLAMGGRPDVAGEPAEPSGLPNIFTALRGLGLKIDSGKGAVDVFVIDDASRPTEN